MPIHYEELNGAARRRRRRRSFSKASASERTLRAFEKTRGRKGAKTRAQQLLFQETNAEFSGAAKKIRCSRVS